MKVFSIWSDQIDFFFLKRQGYKKVVGYYANGYKKKVTEKRWAIMQRNRFFFSNFLCIYSKTVVNWNEERNR